MYVNHMHAWCLQRPEDGVRFSGIGVPDSCDIMWVLGPEPESSAKATGALAAESSASPWAFAFSLPRRPPAPLTGPDFSC